MDNVHLNMEPVTRNIKKAASFCLPKVNLLMTRAIRFMIPVRHSNATNGHLFLGIITLRKNSYSQIFIAKNRIFIYGAAPILLIRLDGNLAIQWKSWLTNTSLCSFSDPSTLVGRWMCVSLVSQISTLIFTAQLWLNFSGSTDDTSSGSCYQHWHQGFR